MTQQEYFAAKGVSNSAMNALQKELYPQALIIESEDAFRFGKLFESRVQDIASVYSEKLFEHGKPGDHELIERMYAALCKNTFAMMVMRSFKTQVPFFRDVTLKYNGVVFTVHGKCLFDWFLSFGGDLKTFSGNNFNAACDRFGWLASRVWYMLVAGTKKDFIIGVSKSRIPKVEVKYIEWGSEDFKKGYEEICRKAYDYFMIKY